MEKQFCHYFKTDEFHFKYATGEPEVTGEEFHDYSEFVFFVKGKAFLISKNIQQDLIPGSMVLIPKESFHQFRISVPEEYMRCIFGFRENSEISALAAEVMSEIKIITVPNDKVVSVFWNIAEIIKSNACEIDKRMFVYSSLIQLLLFCKLYADSEATTKNVNLSAETAEALNIIDERYAERLSVEKLANELYVSPSTLAHKFSKELNISIYRYITKKRLSAARMRILQGESLTDAALNSGFNDYSCFYRLYKKYYAHIQPPL